MKQTKKTFKSTISKLLQSQGTDEVLSEAALPAYAHTNPIIDYIFWKRLDLATSKVKKELPENSNVLDFGCGTGVMSFELAKSNYNVTSIDLDLTPINLLKDKIEYPNRISFIEGDIHNVDFENKKFDAIVALDVLEHIPIEDLPKYIEKFQEILNPEGIIVVSGPTENILYKIGRKIAGNDFTGHYHETTISKIKAVFNSKMKISSLGKLIWPFTLFEVFYAKNN